MDGNSGSNSHPPPKIDMMSDDVITQLKEQSCKVKANKARWDAKVKAEAEHKAVEEKQIAKEKGAGKGGRAGPGRDTEVLIEGPLKQKG